MKDSELKVAETRYWNLQLAKTCLTQSVRVDAWLSKAANADFTSYHELYKASIPDTFRFEKSSRFNGFHAADSSQTMQNDPGCHTYV